MNTLDFTSFLKQYVKYKKVYKNILNCACKHLKIKASLYLSVTLVDNDFIKNLNKTYRNIDKETDVISFAFLDDGDNFNLLYKSNDIVLGEIYISYQKAISQAEEYQHSLDRELRFLFVHGLLHLFGYDHQNENDEKIMFSLQEEILSLAREE